jgi:hypothetical protein
MVEEDSSDAPPPGGGGGAIPDIDMGKIPLLEAFPFERNYRAQGPLKKKQRTPKDTPGALMQQMTGNWKSVWGIVVNSTLYIYESSSAAQKSPPATGRCLPPTTEIQVCTPSPSLPSPHPPTRHDTTRHDKTRHDKTRQDKTRQDTTGQDKTRQDKTRQDKTRQDKTSL